MLVRGPILSGFCMLFSIIHVRAARQLSFELKQCSLRVAPSVKDERVYAISTKSLLPSVPNFWNIIYAKLSVKKFVQR